MNQHLQTILNIIQQAEHLTDEEKAVLSKAAKNADKELEITAFKLERTEKVKHTTGILLEETIEELENKRKAVEAQNHELEVEAALERVRAIAMSMNKPDDMLQVCHIISDQLELLNVKEIRNVQTAIFYESKGTYMNYEYYAKHNKTLITETSFTNHKMHREFAQQMLKGKGEFFTTYISKPELPDWIAYQKTTNVFIDTFLETASSLNYYWYSLGPVALGISTYAPLTENETNLFKRFLKVFELSYRRYLDIEKAEAQAREAQIETSLERVRSKTMAMHKHEDLLGVLDLLVEQLIKLGVQLEVANFSYGIPNGDWDLWIEVVADDGTIFNNNVHFPRIDHPYFHHVEKNIQTFRNDGTDLFKDVFSKEEKASWMDYIHTQTIYKDLTSEEIKQSIYAKPGYAWSMVILKDTWVSICRFNTIPFSDDEDALLRRFANAFGQAYTRFLDLQKAEAQAMEARIEAALEKVRSRSLAMHKSDELQEVVHTVFEKLKELNVDLYTAIIFIFTEGSKDVVWWLANKVNQQYPRMLVPHADNPYLEDIFDAKENGKNFFSATYSFEEKNKLFHHLFEHTDFKYVAEEQKKFLLESELATMSVALAKKTGINITSYSRKSFSEQENEILKRFAKVFEQAYTRFLDLQKAEAQAREAQIELALERVRARTMAMHKSEELIEIMAVMFEQLAQLQLRTDAITLSLDYKKNLLNLWMAIPGQAYPAELKIPYINIQFVNRAMEAVRNGNHFYSTISDFKEKNLWIHHLFEHTIVKNTPDDRKLFLLQAPGLALSMAMGKNIALLVANYAAIPFSDEENAIIKRFAKVFEQSYIRFLDLQKAEAQAREAQIEAALEKVRSHSLAMHKSDELQEVVNIVSDKMNELGVVLDGSVTIKIISEDSKDFIHWSAAPHLLSSATRYEVPYFDHPIFTDFWVARENGLDFFAKAYPFEIKNTFFKHLFEHSDYRSIPDEIKNLILGNDSYAWSIAFHKHSGIYIDSITGKLLSEQGIEILKRFARVFEQAYIRFLDLQRAESQAREAQIETALERVRSRSMGMQKSEELREVIQVVYEQLQHLNFQNITIGFLMDFSETNDFHVWLADPYQTYKAILYCPYLDHPIFNRLIEAKEKGLDFLVNHLTLEEKNQFLDHVFKYLPVSQDIEELKKKLYASPGYVTSVALMKNVALFIENYDGIPFSDAENAIFKRFGKVFEQTYTRFNDLKRAEAQALEVVKRASVDRVRAEIASMRTTNDLERITPLIWNELTTLGVPFVRCGVFIMDEEKQLVETHLSTPDGKAIASFTSGFSGTQLINEVLPYWRKRKIYKAHWDEARFLEQARSLVQQGSVTSGEKYLTENHPTDLYLHFLPFLQGMLYAGNTAPLSDDELQLMQNLADAFSTAYARYEDFNKLEEVKSKIETTLSELKATQHQLVQSEKMASLGELTAGIAHEIQNPLNFVNNFSEVNKEMLEELKAERLKPEAERDDKLENEIINDVIANEEKINLHGKRADSIVKGMLQHSRKSEGKKEPTDINALCDEYLRLSYHGLRAKDKSFNADFKTDFDETIGKINIIPQDVGRVLLNLFNNAFYAVRHPNHLKGEHYKPLVTVGTRKITLPQGMGTKIEITVSDNGNGIPQNIVDKIFQPFFTTKPSGSGTGLGLSLSYDIIKAHGGEIKVETKEGEGSEFIIQLPV